MTPEEIQAMAKGLAEGQALWYLGSALIGGAVTGLTAYLAEVGKNQATKEAFKDVRERLRQTNKDAAQIRQVVEGQGWLAQQRWARREKHYIEMLQALFGYERACERLGEHIAKTPVDKLTPESFDDYRSSVHALYSAFAVAEVFLSDRACATLRALLYESALYAEGTSTEVSKKCHEKADAVREVRDEIRQQAKRDLAAIDDLVSPV